MRSSKPVLLSLIFLFSVFISTAQSSVLYEVKTGKIEFYSEAPKELISATSNKLRGLFDLKKRTFAFKIPVSSFQGFNNPLQREHFNENYMESNKFPEASFSGKIIEEVDLSKAGTYSVRAKGKLVVHGITTERLIMATVVVKNNKLTINSNFTVKLVDHGIKIPRVVFEKLSPEINVSVNADLIPQL